MLRAYDTWHIRHDIDLVRVPVAGSPRTDSTPLVIADGLFATFPATALLPFGRMHHDGDGSIRTDSYVIDNLSVKYFSVGGCKKVKRPVPYSVC